jgi:glycosyltransferase involved in cell wall biosynthesis
MKILLELRPAFDGHAGIPQETRLLFRGLSRIEGCDVEGLIQSSNRILAKGLPARGESRLPEHRRLDRLSRLVVSLQPNAPKTVFDRLSRALQVAFKPAQMVAGTALGLHTPLRRFEGTSFRDFVWRSMFAKSLPAEDFDLVTSARYRVARMPWSGMHTIGLATRKLGAALYPKLDTRDIDVMISETPYPGRVAANTQLVVRYHDAIPLLMPHTISDRSYHRASHYEALHRNVKDGAWFACVSDATRRDLVSIFPAAEARSVTIHNMVSHHYFPETSSPARVPEILRTRRNAIADGGAAADGVHTSEAPPYLLMVSTIEPRKNHLSLLSAWESLRASVDPTLQLVLVGSIGWESEPIMRRIRPWLKRGGVHLLEDVPAQELRVLYRHARCVVCPSFFEGFDFSGVEAMRCGGPVLASDIGVHRDVYGDAAAYFNPYSVEDLEQSLARLLAPSAAARRAELVEAGARVSLQYTPERILPQWQAFLDGLARTRADAAR